MVKTRIESFARLHYGIRSKDAKNVGEGISKTIGGIVFNLMFKFSKGLKEVFSYFTLLILNNNFCFTMLFSDEIYKFMGEDAGAN